MLVIPQSKALALKLKNPERVLATVPKAKVLNVNGADIVVAPHKLDNVRRLRGLGIKAPSPILHYYDWPGRFTPYEHQRLTSAFLTMHKKCLVLNEIGCVDADTEYLTPTGWRRIADYSGGPVAQYWPETGAVDFVTDPEYVKLPCPEMLHVKTKHGVDQMLSPEHRVLLQSRSNPEKRETVSAEELYIRHEGWLQDERSARSRTAVGYSEAAIPTTFHTPGGCGLGLSDAELRVTVAVIADGYIPSGGKMCHVRLKKQRKKDRLRDLLDAAHIPYTYRECKPEGFHRLSFVPPIRAKAFNEDFWAATPDQLRVIVDEVQYWDAAVRPDKPRIEFFSSVKASADFVQYAFAACGYTARLMAYERRGNTEYVVGVSTTRRGWVQLKGTSAGQKMRAIARVPSTDGFKYCFMVPSTYLVLRRNGCIFATGNTGKTQSALWAADYLMSIGMVKKVLILSPLSTLERVWGDAIFKEFYHRKHVVLHGAAARRKKLLKTDVDFYIINHDGFGIIAEEAMGMFDLVIVDEAAVLRNPSTNRYKKFYRWMKGNPDTGLWLMTGTPTPNEPTDAWTLSQLVESPVAPRTYTRFRDQVMLKVGQWKFVPRHDSVDTVRNVLQPSVRFTRDECFDLPDTVMQTRRVELSADQQRHFKTMMRRLVLDLSKEKAATGTISAVNEAVKMQKLVQIACGVAYTDDGQDFEIDCSPRITAVEEVIEEAGEKVILFVPLTGTLHMLERRLSKRWSVGVVNGSVPRGKRDRIFYDFQKHADPHILLAHPATMSHGLTLTAASTVIWYGPITSNEQYVQANGRVERIGKRHVSNVVHIEGTDLEHAMFKRLANKQKLQGLLLDMIKGNMEV